MLRVCMNSEDPEMLGIACTVLSEHAECIEGELLPVEVWPFYIRYYEKCIRENPDGEWSDSRYSAAHDLMSRYKHARNRSDVPRHYLEDVRRMLRTVYENGDESVKGLLSMVPLSIYSRTTLSSRSLTIGARLRTLGLRMNPRWSGPTGGVRNKLGAGNRKYRNAWVYPKD